MFLGLGIAWCGVGNQRFETTLEGDATTMSRKHLTLLLLLAAPACGWAPDTSDSTGVCEGRLAGRALDGALDLSASEYHREQDQFVARLSYRRGALQVAGAVPAEFTAGASEFALEDGKWSLLAPSGAGRGRVKVEQTTPYRMLGTLEVEDGEDRVSCSFDLRRAIEFEAGPD